MRFKLILRPEKDRQHLLFNYQYPLMAWLYGLLHRADADYAAFLHQQGYAVPDRRKSFKHFTFSSLLIPQMEKPRPGDTYMVLRSKEIENEIQPRWFWKVLLQGYNLCIGSRERASGEQEKRVMNSSYEEKKDRRFVAFSSNLRFWPEKLPGQSQILLVGYVFSFLTAHYNT